MFGEDGDFRGIIPRAVEYVFQTLANLDDIRDLSISCSFLEIYNDSVRDLGKAYYIQQLQARGETEGAKGKQVFINEKTSDLFDNISRYRTNPYFAPAFAKKNIAFPSEEKFEDIMKRPGLKQVMGEYQSMNLQIHEDSQGNVFVKDLTSIPLSYVEEALAVINMGIKVRATHETKMNSVSSRSHTVFNLTVTHRDKVTGHLISGMLNLVDLAGSERIKKSESQGPRLKEALHINSSLSALGKVVMALERGDYVPYRDSKLTRLLQNSLGGNSYTSLLTAIHPCPSYYDECLSTLQFANRCLNVRNNPRVNYVGDEGVEDKDRKIRRLMEEINQLRVKLVQYERKGGGGGALTGLALAEKMVSVLHKMGIKASIGADGSLRTTDGKNVSLNELNEVANVSADTDEAAKRSDSQVSEKLPAQLRVYVEELEKDNESLKQKNKQVKAKNEQLGKQLQELSDEFDQRKQAWQHKEFLLRQSVTEAEVKSKGIQEQLDRKHAEVYRNLVQANKEILDTNLNAINKIPSSLREHQTGTRLDKTRNVEEFVIPLKDSYQRTLNEYKDTKEAEIENLKKQYDYWLQEKDDALSKVVSGFNKYREKKSKQQRKCEQEIVTLYKYAEQLESIVEMAEEGKFYTQQAQPASEDAPGAQTAATMLIPATMKPVRPGTGKSKSADLSLSRRIIRKNDEQVAQSQQIKQDAMEAMLRKHGGQESRDDSNRREDVIDTPDIASQIRSLINSPSVERNILADETIRRASAPNMACRIGPSSKREKLFSRGEGKFRRQSEAPGTASSISSRAKTVQVHAAAGTGPRAANSIRKTVSIASDNEKKGERAAPSPEVDMDSTLFRNPENIQYVFNDEDFGNSKISSSSYDEALVVSPPNTSTPAVRNEQIEFYKNELSKKEDQIEALETQIEELRSQLEESQQVDINQILESVEGNETLEYIRQLESEQISLRQSVRETSTQLQNAKVANAALTRQFQSYKSQMQKRPNSGKVITLKS